jgi:hypothetical protein
VPFLSFKSTDTSLHPEQSPLTLHRIAVQMAFGGGLFSVTILDENGNEITFCSKKLSQIATKTGNSDTLADIWYSYKTQSRVFQCVSFTSAFGYVSTSFHSFWKHHDEKDFGISSACPRSDR